MAIRADDPIQKPRRIRKVVLCPKCQGPMANSRAKQCQACHILWQRSLEGRMIASTKQRGPRPYRKGKLSAERVEKMRAWWTPERREEHRRKLMSRVPSNHEYKGLSASMRKEIVKNAGKCNRCQHDGTDYRLEIHHRNRNKHDQSPENLEVLCQLCHLQEHHKEKEIGMSAFRREMRVSKSSAAMIL